MFLSLHTKMEAKFNKGEEEEISDEETTASLDWRGRPSNPLKHGGMRAAAFVLGTQYSLSRSLSLSLDCI